jgi:hypothetical protein
MDNAAIAELLVREAKIAEYHWGRAFRRAARAAHMWPVEAGELFAARSRFFAALIKRPPQAAVLSRANCSGAGGRNV